MVKQKGIYIILSSPSGAGKTSLAKKLLKKNKNFELSVSYTTRKKRPKEINKKDYHFISKKEFNTLKKRSFFIEWAKVFNNYYGTSLEKTKKINKLGRDILFDIDWQGSRKIKKKLIGYDNFQGMPFKVNKKYFKGDKNLILYIKLKKLFQIAVFNKNLIKRFISNIG